MLTPPPRRPSDCIERTGAGELVEMSMIRATALLLTVLTGFSALVYQVAWQRYLAALLGSHSEATAAVLGIFLGGLSYGYSRFGRLTERLVAAARRQRRRPRLLLAYGFVEFGIGVYALLFPLLFAALRVVSLWVPGGSEALSFSVDVGLTALLIGPPVVLMGGTIPLLTQALATSLRDATRFHALVYAFNTAGAFAGALVAGFFLVPWLGLQNSVLLMGVVNLAAGSSFIALGLRGSERGLELAESQSSEAAAPRNFVVYAFVALLSGFAMMALQNTMNRIGAFSLGASHFTFSMVVATFVLCIALGSFAVSAFSRIPRSVLPTSQWMLVAFLLFLYPVVEDAPYWAHLLRTSFPSDDASFYPYFFGVFLGILIVFSIPLGLSGAALPLLFHHLRREVGDLGRTAGRLYSWNTVGSLLGALLGGYVLLFWLDLHHVYRLAVLALAVGAAILTVKIMPRSRLTAGAILIIVSGTLVALPAWSPKKLSSGLFRQRTPTRYTHEGPKSLFDNFRKKVIFYQDDPTVSAAVHEFRARDGSPALGIVVNGKPDSAIPIDTVTVGMLALLPALLVDRCERGFVIGFGTGRTVGELAAIDEVKEVDVAEISQGVIDAAPYFEERNRHAFSNPKTRIIRGDAYRVLLRSEGRYDVIISEPSNPWVTGVELLYSLEFLQAARSRLTPGGIYVQWIHIYEIDAPTVALVLNTYRRVFDRVEIWYSLATDLLLLGFNDDDHRTDLDALLERWEREGFDQRFSEIGIGSFHQLLAHQVLPAGGLNRAEFPDEVHTIGHPILSHRAARAFFAGGIAELPTFPPRWNVTSEVVPALLPRYRARLGQAFTDEMWFDVVVETCSHHLSLCAALAAQWQFERPDSQVREEFLAGAQDIPTHAAALAPELLDRLSLLFSEQGSAALPPTYDSAAQLSAMFDKYYHHAAAFDARAPRAAWLRCADDERCAAELARH